MEQRITVRNKQSLLDIAIQEAGTIEAVFEIAAANNLSLTDQLSPGMALGIPSLAIIDREVQEYYKNKGIRPATGEYDPGLKGIGYWKIGIDFKVS